MGLVSGVGLWVLLAIALVAAFSVAQALGLNDIIQQHLGTYMPGWSIAVSLFILSYTVTYFIGSDWGAVLFPILTDIGRNCTL